MDIFPLTYSIICLKYPPMTDHSAPAPEILEQARQNAHAAMAQLGVTDARVEPIVLGQAARRAQQGAAIGIDDFLAVARETQAVLNAKDALALLAGEDAGLATRVAKILPGHAVRRAQKGLPHDVANLAAAAREGIDSLKAIFNQAATPQSLLQRYQEIAAALRPAPQAPRARHDYYNAAHDEFALHFDRAPWMMHPREMFEMDRMAYEMDRGIAPREMAWRHAMMRDHVHEQDRHRSFYDGLRRTLAEKDESLQKKLAGRLLDHAHLRHMHHFASMALRMGKFALLEDVLPSALAGVSGRDAHDYFNHRFLYELLHALPHSEKLVLRLLEKKNLWDERSLRNVVLQLAKSASDENGSLQTLLGMDLRLSAKEWLSIAVDCAARAPAAACHALARVDADTRDDQLGYGYANSLSRIVSHGADVAAQAALAHPLCRNIDWARFFESNHSAMPADRLHMVAATAQRLSPGWTQHFAPQKISRTFKSEAEVRELFALLPAGYVEAHMQDFIKAAMSGTPASAECLLPVLSGYAAMAALPVYATLTALGLNDTRLGLVLPYFDLTRLSDEQREKIIAYHRQNNSSLNLLLQSGPVPQTMKDELLVDFARNATGDTHGITTIGLLLQSGADVGRLDPASRARIEQLQPHFDRWQRVTRQLPPHGLLRCDPTPFRPAVFNDLMQVMHAEGYGAAYAYKAMALFQSGDRVLQYLKKWGKPNSSQPLHNVLQAVQLPEDLSGVNLNDWGDAILRHGPDMAKLVKFCKSIPSPARTDDGSSWSLVKTREIAAQFVYARGGEHRALAALCHKHNVSEQSFNTALDIVQQTPPMEKDLPEIDIDGKRFGLENARFRKLANDDIRSLFLGELTACCQSIGGHGSNCARHGYTSPNGGFYVVETQGGEIIGQTWAWRGQKGELVFDSLEMLSDRVSAEQWHALVGEVVKDVSAKKTQHNITALMVGSSGETPASFAQTFAKTRPAGPVMTYATYAPPKDAPPAIEAAVPRDYSGYRDSNTQYVIWQKPAKPAPKRTAKPK